MKLRVTLVQQVLVWQDPAANRRQFEALLTPLKGQTDLVVLPETFTTGFTMDVQSAAEPARSDTERWLQEQADKLDAVVTGSVITKDGGRFYNRLHWATPRAGMRYYDKRHLFRMAHEDQHFTPGKAPLCVEWRGFRVFPLVCFDLRFPVFSRHRAGLEYDLLLYVANWPSARRYAWSTLLRARAIENLSYVVGVNRIGTDANEHAYSGDSVALNYRGEPMAELGSDPAVVTVELELEPLRAFRERFPAHLDADRFTLLES
jgi:omega-amidase